MRSGSCLQEAWNDPQPTHNAEYRERNREDIRPRGQLSVSGWGVLNRTLLVIRAGTMITAKGAEDQQQDGCEREWDDMNVTTPFEPALVPELLVADLDQSIRFWCDLCGFVIGYSRWDERFAYITLGSAHVMLEQVGAGRNWVTGSLERPLGRGVNLQITVPDIRDLVTAFTSAGVELFLQPETKSYHVEDEHVGVRQFLVQDPDGYLVRFQSSVGRRPAIR